MEPAKTTYQTYLKIPELLDLQERLSSPPHHDEMLFIIVHQVHELWFKQILHELQAIRDALNADKPLTALKSLKRVHAIQRVLLEQIDVLETMTPVEFNAFRDLLRPASGFQSVQFREIEILSGGGDGRVLSHLDASPELARLEARFAETTIWQALLAHLSRRGHSIPSSLLEPASPEGRFQREPNADVVAAFRSIYESSAEEPAPEYVLYLLAEAFLDYDELMLHWRARHVRMVERTIGMKRGTGGSSGAEYLSRTLAYRFFPELWEVRSHLGSP